MHHTQSCRVTYWLSTRMTNYGFAVTLMKVERSGQKNQMRGSIVVSRITDCSGVGAEHGVGSHGVGTDQRAGLLK